MLDRPLSSDADYFISCQVVPSWPNLCPSCQCHLSLCTKALFIFTSVPGPVESRTSEPEGASLSFHRRVKASSRNGWILTRAEVERSTSQPRAPSGSLRCHRRALGCHWLAASGARGFSSPQRPLAVWSGWTGGQSVWVLTWSRGWMGGVTRPNRTARASLPGRRDTGRRKGLRPSGQCLPLPGCRALVAWRRVTNQLCDREGGFASPSLTFDSLLLLRDQAEGHFCREGVQDHPPGVGQDVHTVFISHPTRSASPEHVGVSEMTVLSQFSSSPLGCKPRAYTHLCFCE